MAPYLGYDSDTTFIPGTLNTSSSLTIQGGGITQTGGDVNLDSGTLFIDEDLNGVGIGTTNPGLKLNVQITSTAFVNGTVLNSYPIAKFINAASDNGARGLEIGAPTGSVSSPIYLKVSGTGNRFAILNQSDSEQLTVLTSGNVGIGTTNPSEKLEVTGKFRLFDGGYPYIDIGITTSNYFRLIHDNPNDRFYIGKNNNATLVITGTNNVEPGADNSYNLGSSTKRWANIYSADLQLSNEGSSNDVDGTWGAYTIQEGEENLYLINRRSGKKFKFVLEEVE